MSATLIPVSPPAVVLAAVQAAVEQTYTRFCGDKPTVESEMQADHDCECVAGIISFFGDAAISLAWVLDAAVAPVLAQKFARFPIPFDSSEMGDVTGELVNVIAGDVVAYLEARKFHVKMSLPTVARGARLRLMPDKGVSVSHVNYATRAGKFWLRLAAQVD
ncbi:chemotaxis protein CheX [Limnoglobus roseus]|uniref:Chemotaxis protein CheX n=1 Tax=Limnoglobus roseus TaxID=2598579 RepID=A0A5C1ARA3_9BACT|nr:chemotaxis protein CheX [Limnoglobus roseus]QEL20583.1 chemotaxis protein CheX [Limnoglobus roseus]